MLIILTQNIFNLWFEVQFSLKGVLHPNQKLVCFVLYLKIINTFLKNNIHASYSKLSKELKNGIEILVGPAIF